MYMDATPLIVSYEFNEKWRDVILITRVYLNVLHKYSWFICYAEVVNKTNRWCPCQLLSTLLCSKSLKAGFSLFFSLFIVKAIFLDYIWQFTIVLSIVKI